jgi:RNA polymerase sigma-70 factor (ECF subfamily)
MLDSTEESVTSALKRAVVFLDGNRFHLVPVRANGQPAFGMYLRTPGSEHAQGYGIMVFTLAGNKISAMTRFDATVLPRFGLPPARGRAELDPQPGGEQCRVP